MNAITQLRPGSSGSPDLALLLAAVEAFPQSLAVAEGGILVYVNPAWTQMFECLDPLQVRGKALDEFVPGQFFHSPTLGGINAGEFSHLRRDGTEEQLRVAAAGFRVRGKEFQVLSASSVEPQTHAGTGPGEAQRLEAVGRLAGGVAHDFNNLLTGIILYCDLLIAELERDSRSRHHALEIRKAGEDGARLVQQLLAVAHPRTVESRVLALNEVVAGTEELLIRLIGENIVLTKSLAEDLGVVRTDPAHVQQILLNLVLNARDAMPEGGHITLATRNCTARLQSPQAGSPRRKDDGYGDEDGQKSQSRLVACVELTVSDTGCGMDSATLGRAFEPFFTTKVSGQGTGLGLATAWRLAKLEGGTIVAESQPGIGTRVSLLLPRVDHDDHPADSDLNESSPEDSKSSRPKRSNLKARGDAT